MKPVAFPHIADLCTCRCQTPRESMRRSYFPILSRRKGQRECLTARKPSHPLLQNAVICATLEPSLCRTEIPPTLKNVVKRHSQVRVIYESGEAAEATVKALLSPFSCNRLRRGFLQPNIEQSHANFALVVAFDKLHCDRSRFRIRLVEIV